MLYLHWKRPLGIENRDGTTMIFDQIMFFYSLLLIDQILKWVDGISSYLNVIKNINHVIVKRKSSKL